MGHHLACFCHANAGCIQGSPRGVPIRNQKMGDTLPFCHEGAPTFDAYTSASQCFAHVRESSATILEDNR
jgi:hypothetical protein